jgi:hypothetical protein
LRCFRADAISPAKIAQMAPTLTAASKPAAQKRSLTPGLAKDSRSNGNAAAAKADHAIVGTAPAAASPGWFKYVQD